MGTFSTRVREWLAAKPARDQVQARIVPTWQAGRPLARPDDYAKLAQEGYRQNALIAACIFEIVSSGAEPPLRAVKDLPDGRVEPLPFDHALSVLCRNPNPEQSGYDFIETILTQQQISGNWYVRKARALAGNLLHLFPVRPDRVEVVPGKDGYVQEYRDDGRPLAADDVIHGKLHYDPLNEWYGLSPIAVVARFVDLDNNAGDFLRAFFYNDGTPAGILKFKARVEPDDRRRVKELWTQEHSGMQGWHSVSVLDGDADYKDIGVSPEKLRMNVIWETTESRICSIMGVPSAVVGALVGTNPTYSNYKEARASFYQETLSTLWRKTADRLTAGLRPEFSDERIRLEFDLSKVAGLQEDIAVRRTFAIASYEKGFATLNEARALAGMAPSLDADADQRKTAPSPDLGSAFSAFSRRHRASRLFDVHGDHEQHGATIAEKTKARKAIQALMTKHYQAERKALLAHLEEDE